MEKAYALTVGKKWMDNWNMNLNKTFDRKDCLDMVKAMWDSHIYTAKQAKVAADMQSKFARKYKCVVLDRLKPDIARLLSNEDVFEWRGGGKTHIIGKPSCLMRSGLNASLKLWKQLNQMEVCLFGKVEFYSKTL